MSVDDSTRREINKIVERILRDSSLEPPIDINENFIVTSTAWMSLVCLRNLLIGYKSEPIRR